MTTTRSALRRRTTAASAALILGLALTACGGGDEAEDTSGDEESSAPATPAQESTATEEPTTDATEPSPEEPATLPTEAELTAVLLTPADLPDGFAVGPDDGEEDGGFEGTCLEELGDFDDALGTEAETEAEVELIVQSAAGQSSVSSGVKAFDTEDLATTFVEFTETLKSCTTVDATDDGGITYSLQVAYDDAVELPGADEALQIQVTGTATAGAESFDLDARFVVGVFGPLLSNVGTFAVGEDSTGVLDLAQDLATLQAERIADGLG